MSCCIGTYDNGEVEGLLETDPLNDERAYCTCVWFGRKVGIDCMKCNAVCYLGSLGVIAGASITAGGGFFMNRLLHSADSYTFKTIGLVGSGIAICVGIAIVVGTVYVAASQAAKKRRIGITNDDGIRDEGL